jgi:hypothetical protein
MSMIYAVFFVPAEGVHPVAKLEWYPKLWSRMHESARKLGIQITHLTDTHTESWGDQVFRTELDPLKTVYSRDVSWARFVEQLEPGQQACMIEPDTILCKHVPPIRPCHDLVVLRRPEKCVPGGFKLATREAAPFYRKVVENYAHVPTELHSFHGDIHALHRTLGIKPGERAHTIPRIVEGCRIEARDWYAYGYRKHPDPYLLQYKGTSKTQLLCET